MKNWIRQICRVLERFHAIEQTSKLLVLEIMKNIKQVLKMMYNSRPLIFIGTIYMPTVQVRQNEPFDIILRRFRRACERAGVFSESRRRQSYEKPTTVRKRDNDAAVRREMKRVARQRTRHRRLY